MQSEKLRNVTVTYLNFIVVNCPFLYLSVLADLRLRQFFYHFCELFCKSFVPAENFCRLYDVGEQYGKYLRVHGRPHAQAALCSAFGHIGVFGRDRRAGHEMTVAVLGEVLSEELGSLF